MYITIHTYTGYEVVANDFTQEITYWKTLSVDLEKKKVVYPDWSTARHFQGVLTKCTVTRNKERLYDIDYEDGAKLLGVREEHIRWLSSNDQNRNNSSSGNNGSSSGSSGNNRNDGKKKVSNNIKDNLIARLQEGVRVHAKIVFKGGVEKYVPGRVLKVHRGGTYDIECEGGRTEINMGLDDVTIGLVEVNIYIYMIIDEDPYNICKHNKHPYKPFLRHFYSYLYICILIYKYYTHVYEYTYIHTCIHTYIYRVTL